MRRLARQSRDDAYNSKRDYQQTHVRQSAQLVNDSANVSEVIFSVPATMAEPSLAWGGYFAANTSLTVPWRLRAGTTDLAIGKISLDNRWSKAGGYTDKIEQNLIFLILELPPGARIDVWGLDAGTPAKEIGKAKIDITAVLAGNLTPESFYLDHELALNLDFSEGSPVSTIAPGRQIVLKKCSYCGRLLPIDPERLGALAFHKHNAKRTKHQNECLSCKKWKINDDLNPTRSSDQLHESSVITRERKLFLREPHHLKEFKERNNGTGLRSYIWNKFDQKCFVCGAKVKVDEFQLDHTRPMAYLWPIDKHATCLCAVHNNEKKDKFPIDYYNADQLEKLSTITGLSLKQLQDKSVNQTELKRILADLEGFARAWAPRTFFATARKIREIHQDCDLEAELQSKNPELYSRLLLEYNPREDPESTASDLEDAPD